MRLGALAWAAVVLAGCASGPSSTASPAQPADGPLVAAPGPFLQMCGGVSDAEFQQITGMPAQTTVLRNLVGCQFENVGTRQHGSFSWYRGSPIGREHTIVDTVGRTVREVQVGGQDGYEGRTSDGALCEVGIAFGDDFFVWSLVLPPGMGHDACESATTLAGMTVERAQ